MEHLRRVLGRRGISRHPIRRTGAGRPGGEHYTVVFVIRYRDGIDQKMRIVYNGDNYDILNKLEVGGGLICGCRRNFMSKPIVDRTVKVMTKK